MGTLGDGDLPHPIRDMVVHPRFIEAPRKPEIGVQCMRRIRTDGQLTRTHLQFGTRGLCSLDRKSTRLNSSHVSISYAAFCSKKKIVAAKSSVGVGGIPPLVNEVKFNDTGAYHVGLTLSVTHEKALLPGVRVTLAGELHHRAS